MFLLAATSASYWPFVVLAISVAFIIIAISALRMHAFVALILAALLAGLLANKSSWDIVQKDGSVKAMSSMVGVVEMVSKGLGDTARDIAISIALAAIIGMCLMESGSADKVVRRFLAFFGEKHAGWALLWSTFILSAPIFFDTMFMLMVPLAMALRMRTGKDYTLYLMAICCGGTVTHSMTVPHPGPVAVVDDLHLNVGESIIGGMMIGAITCVFGFMFSKWLNRRTDVPLRATGGVSLDDLKSESAKPESELPSFFWSMTPVLLPIILISLTTVFELAHKGAATGAGWGVALVNFFGGDQSFTAVRAWVDFIGHKNIALFIGAAISLWVLAKQRGFGLKKVEELVGPPLETAGMIILITSAGGAFGLALRSAGVGDAVKVLAQGYSLNLVLLGWLVAAVVRVAQGSATVAMLTTSSIMAPMLVGTQLGCHPVYLFTAIGFGAMFCSWMNDSGFWVVNRLSGMTEKETLRTWSLQLTADSIIGLLVTLTLSKLLPMV
ncbi:GntP family permease [Prosthecobacter sp.]|jgi:GntP family gluconate:H+ symporter|uniref:GntP family permease n=1 Tax=Prosthecobacter sp. TaxID=1965333 RepID=UPI0037C8CA1A